MAKRKKQSKRPQAKHKSKSPASRHDKRKRLALPIRSERKRRKQRFR